jgi:hypothetical protein
MSAAPARGAKIQKLSNESLHQQLFPVFAAHADPGPGQQQDWRYSTAACAKQNAGGPADSARLCDKAWRRAGRQDVAALLLLTRHAIFAHLGTWLRLLSSSRTKQYAPGAKIAPRTRSGQN